jgi:biotin carboxyl carrier protein
MKYVASINGNEFIIEIIDEKTVIVNGKTLTVNFDSVSGQPVYSFIVDGKSYEAYVYPGEEDWQVLLQGQLYPVIVEDEREKRLRAAAGGAVADTGEYHMKAPMPGMVVSISVEEGQKVEKGQVLVILESMKMQNELKSPRAGKINRIRVKSGDSVEQRQTLLSVT